MNQLKNTEIINLISQFNIEGEPLVATQQGGGLINSAYLVETTKAKYLFQRINSYVFPNVEKLMQNILKVTIHLKKKGATTLKIIPTKKGELYFEKNGKFFRTYSFIENTVSYSRPPSAEVFTDIGKAFGEFQNLLSDFNASDLYESIKDFHNTLKRYDNFISIAKEDKLNLTNTCRKEIDAIVAQKDTLALITDGLSKGYIPLRVTHNDTKMNNVLLSATTEKAVAVIDLDTVMPGSMLYDFGDAIRSGANLTTEDDENLNEVVFSVELFTAFAKGFCGAVKNSITETEIELLPYSAYLMTMECAIRFLTDYLEGGVYFKPKDNSLNLIRATNQICLALQIEEQLPKLNEIITDIFK